MHSIFKTKLQKMLDQTMISYWWWCLSSIEVSDHLCMSIHAEWNKRCWSSYNVSMWTSFFSSLTIIHILKEMSLPAYISFHLIMESTSMALLGINIKVFPQLSVVDNRNVSHAFCICFVSFHLNFVGKLFCICSFSSRSF